MSFVHEPIRLAPIFKENLWGGTSLRPLLGAPPSTALTGEAWLFCDQDDDVSTIADGAYAGRTIRELTADFPAEVLGSNFAYLKRVPLLLKIIDAQKPLSVQVHPTDDLARRLENKPYGKTEAWLILNREANGCIYAGLKPHVTHDVLVKAISNGTVETVLQMHKPQERDCFSIHAGMVHAIGGGIQLFEIQQPSDLTYRLYDWGRVDPKSGKPRELHLERGLMCVSYQQSYIRPIEPTLSGRIVARPNPLVSNEAFTLTRIETNQNFDVFHHVRNKRAACILVCLAGEAKMRYEKKEYRMVAGETWLIPGSLGILQVEPMQLVEIAECGFNV